MHLVMCIDDDRARDDQAALARICTALSGADVSQTHVLCEPPLGATRHGLIEQAEVVTTRMPARWPRRMAIVQRVVDRLERNEPDAVLCSGFDAHRLGADLAATFDIPLIVDAWTSQHIAAARWRGDVEVWMARSGGVADALRRTVRAGRVVEARPPLPPNTTPRVPGCRPSVVVLDPEASPRTYEPIADAVADLAASREDCELFVELNSAASHRIWRLYESRNLLHRVTMIDDAGAVSELVAAATVVVAPAPAARTVLAQALLGGAALITGQDTLEDLAVHDRSALLLDMDRHEWAPMVRMLLDDPGRRSALTHAAVDAARMACLPDTTDSAWIEAVHSVAQQATYPVGTTTTTA